MDRRFDLFRGLFHPAKAFHFIVVLSCSFFYLATCEPCAVNGMQKSAEYKGCGSYGGSAPTHPTSENVCTDLNLLCFPSTLPGLLSKEHKQKRDALEISKIQSDSPLSTGTNQANSGASNQTWLSQSSMFKLLNGRTISCYLSSEESTGELSSIGSDIGDHNGFSSCRQTLLNQKSKNVGLKNSELRKPGSFDVSSSPKVEINPPALDWGQKYLFSPSVAFLTVANSFRESILHVYELFSTSSQFYPCNSSEILLGPGEVASICFVFLPRWLGLSTGHLILQTSSGGFLVPTRGFGVESPYKFKPLVGMDVLSSGRLSENLSLLNPYDETLHVVEVTSWISVSVGNMTHHTEASCSIENFQNSDEFSLTSVDDWLVIMSGQVGFPLMAMRPRKNWEIGPHNSETIMEMDFPFGLEGKIFGAFCMKLLRSPYNVSDTVMIPLEVDLDSKVAYEDLQGPISVSLEPLVSFDTRGNVVVVSLRNGASYMLNVVRISEVAETKIFQIKYVEGLLLFPGTVTQVSLITCTHLPVQLHDSLPESSNINGDCKLLIMTNDSSSPQIEIPCQDIVHVCSRHQMDLSKNYPGNAEAGNMMTGSGGGDGKVPLQIKTLETVEADELVLGNWKSQGITSGVSVLDDHEVLFPIVQIGSYNSKWITVKNPSQQPVVMQLILNSGEIIDECRDADGFVEPPSSGSLVQGKSTRPTRYGFSIAESAVTEAYVHPHGRASFGPILFHPSNRCAWRSSALIRNNLSGVEWLSLRGFGGSLSLVLFEGSELIESIEFKFNLSLPVPHNVTPPDILFHMEETTSACSQPISKELYAKNMGDLPLEVMSIEVSGSGCKLDGFMVHTCKGFSLEPGESTKLLISYQTEFSAAMVHRDLELALATGIYVIPMKASVPVFMLNICQKSVFWMRLKKFCIAVLLAVSLMFLVFCCLYLQMIALGSQDYFYNSEKSTITAIKTAGKSSLVHRNQKNSRISLPGEMDCVLRSVDEDTTSREASSGKYPESKIGNSMKEMAAQHANLTLENHGHSSNSSDTEKERALPCLPSKALVVETSNTIEASYPGDLTIRVGKEKGRKRRRRKVAGAGLSGLLEVSSSQSGNSTPSSPLSPVTTLIPNRSSSLTSDVDAPKYLFAQVAEGHSEKGPVPEPPAETKLLEPQPVRYQCNHQYSTPVQPSAPIKTARKPVLLPSATFPSTGKAAPGLLCSSPLASASTIAPHARAPGSKLYQETPKREQAGFRYEYTYDIWGDHLSGPSLIGRSNAVSSVNYSATKSDSDSFFVSGPQALMRNSQSRSVSSLYQGG